MASLTETYPCAPSTERGRGILISGDSKSNTILYTNGRSVFIRSLDNPQDVRVYVEHSHPVTVARYSPNAEWIASADSSGIVRIWGSRDDFVLKNEFKVLSSRIDDLQWSHDMLRIVSSGDAKGTSFVRAFMWDSGSTVGDFEGHSKRVLSCAFKPTRPFRIVTCGEDFLVNFYQGPPFKFKMSIRDHSNFVNCVRYSPDGSKFITVSSDKQGMLYDGNSGEKIGELSSEDGHQGSIYAVSWSPDSKQVVTVSADKCAKVWDISEDGSGKVNKTLTCPGSGGVDDMLVGCLWQNDHLVTVSLGGMINIFSASDLEKAPTSLSGHIKNVSALSVLKNHQNMILSCSYDGVIAKWIQGVGYRGKINMKSYAPIKYFTAVDGEIILAGFDNKVWRVPFNGDDSGASENVDVGSQPQDLSIAVDTPEMVLVSTASGLVLLNGLKVISSIVLGFPVTASAISPDAKQVILGAQDGKLHIYSITADAFTEEAVLEKHRGAITVIRYSPDLSMFASGDVNREALVWDRSSTEVKLNNMLYHTARINCLAWSPNSSIIATGSLDTNVIIYEIGKPASARLTIKGAHLGGVYGVAFTDEHTIASSGEDGCVRLWTLTQQ